MAKKEKDEDRFEVRTANPGFRGERCGVRFLDGAARTADKKLAEACADAGYLVTDLNRATPRDAADRAGDAGE